MNYNSERSFQKMPRYPTSCGSDFLKLIGLMSSFTAVASILSIGFLYFADWSCIPRYQWPSVSSHEVSCIFLNRDYGQGLRQKFSKFCHQAKIICVEGKQALSNFSGFTLRESVRKKVRDNFSFFIQSPFVPKHVRP